MNHKKKKKLKKTTTNTDTETPTWNMDTCMNKKKGAEDTRHSKNNNN